MTQNIYCINTFVKNSINKKNDHFKYVGIDIDELWF